MAWATRKSVVCAQNIHESKLPFETPETSKNVTKKKKEEKYNQRRTKGEK